MRWSSKSWLSQKSMHLRIPRDLSCWHLDSHPAPASSVTPPDKSRCLFPGSWGTRWGVTHEPSKSGGSLSQVSASLSSPPTYYSLTYDLCCIPTIDVVLQQGLCIFLLLAFLVFYEMFHRNAKQNNRKCQLTSLWVSWNHLFQMSWGSIEFSAVPI